MKKVRVIVKDKHLLELSEDACKGDLVDLKELVEVDSSYLENIIESGKDKVYESKLSELKKTLDAQNKVEVNKLLSDIEALKKENSNALKIKEQEMEKKNADSLTELKLQISKLESQKKIEIENLTHEKQLEINKLYEEINLAKQNSQNELALKESEVEKKYINQISDLQKEIEILKANKESEIKNINLENSSHLEKIKNDDEKKYAELEQKLKSTESELKNEYEKKISEIISDNKLALASKDAEITNIKSNFDIEKQKVLLEQKEKFEEDLKKKDDLIYNLQRAKASMNVKQTGEDLESWCNIEVLSYMQNGLTNCTWIKDNVVVKDEGETKGSKADYIFKIYASNKHEDNELLTSICMDMKDENPDSVNKKTNADYYKQLDKNRTKKNCKYAVLVSNLETDKPNVLPMYRVTEYQDMYVVRPAYLMVFLNMIASLTTRFSDLILTNKQDSIALQNKVNLIKEFEEIKKTYLDKPLALLESSIDSIMSSSETIKKACKSIDDQCDKINRSYISQITEKINKFDLKLDKGIAKKLAE